MTEQKELVDLNPRHIRRSNVKIDVMIPVIEKDLPVLPHVIDGIRQHVKHPIGEIYIVAPDHAQIKDVCEKNMCKFVCEDSVLPITKREAGSGWMLQQLLKLNGEIICSNENFLAIDADTVMIAPHIFIHHNQYVFYCADQYWDNKPMFDHYQKLMGMEAVAPVSLINHYMFFNKTHLAQMKELIESRHGMPWYQAILEKSDPNAFVPFSEFETYGNYMLSKFPNKVILNRGKNLDYRQGQLELLSTLDLNKTRRSYKSISFHNREWEQQQKS